MTTEPIDKADVLRELFGLEGQVALVIGASSGLGARSARVLAGAGASVGVAARRIERLDEMASEIGAMGVASCASPVDVTLPGDIERCFDEVEAKLGPVTILVYASGVSPLGRAERQTREKWNHALDVNVTGAFEASQCAARRMIERKNGGTIVHIASINSSGASPVHKAVGYTASKGALAGLTRQLAVEWTQHGIRVNALAPGYFATEMTIDPRYDGINPDHLARIETFTPMGRVGRVDELDTALLFLTAPRSSYVTGAVIPVDGGWTAW